MKIGFFSWLTNNKKNTDIDFDSFYKSFKKFHPNIDLIIFDDNVINKLFTKNPWLNYSNCKASFAKLIYNKYDVLVNVDADFYFFDKCEEILKADYDIAACSNYNIQLNCRLQPTNINGYNIPAVDESHYVQGGLIASTSKKFWEDYEQYSRDLSDKMAVKENDVLNVIWHSNLYNTKILDGDYDFRSPNFKCYYNCSSLGRIHNCVIKDDKIYLDDKPMRSYHVAYGFNRKSRVNEIFPSNVSDWFYKKINT